MGDAELYFVVQVERRGAPKRYRQVSQRKKDREVVKRFKFGN